MRATWTQQYTAEQAPVSWSDPSDTLTRGEPALWIQALETGDLDVVQDGGGEETISFAAGETRSGRFVSVSDSDIDFIAGNGSVPVVPGGAVGPTGPTGPAGATGATGPTGYTPGNGAHWTNPDPTTIAGALD